MFLSILLRVYYADEYSNIFLDGLDGGGGGEGL